MGECKEEAAGEVRGAIAKIKKGVRWEDYSCCFDCGLPQVICERVEWKQDTGG